MRWGFSNYLMVFGIVFMAVFLANTLSIVPSVRVAEVVDVTDEEIMIMQDILASKQIEIEKLELLQPPDYSDTIMLVAWFFFVIVTFFSYQWFGHKKELKRMELEAEANKK